jgi:hypothetical protein
VNFKNQIGRVEVKKLVLKGLFGAFVTGVLAAGAFVGSSSALDLSGKKVTMIVPFKEGGGTDGLARLFAPYLQKELPGNPEVIVLNQPGGGGVTGTNKFQRTAEKDGTVIGMGSTSTFVAYAIGGDKIKYDPMSWEPIMLMLRGAIVYANADKMGLKGGMSDPKGDVAIAQSKGVVIGMKTPTSAELSDYISWRIMGANVKPVFGLSTSKQRKAFFRQEIMANVDGTGPYLKKVVGKSDFKTVSMFAFGYNGPDGKRLRDPDAPDVPTMEEFYQAAFGKAPFGPAYDAYLNITGLRVMSKLFALPPGTPRDVVDAYISVMKRIAKDPKAAKAIKKTVGSLPVYYGEDAKPVMAAGFKIKPSARDWMAKELGEKFNVKM